MQATGSLVWLSSKASKMLQEYQSLINAESVGFEMPSTILDCLGLCQTIWYSWIKTVYFNVTFRLIGNILHPLILANIGIAKRNELSYIK